jgi:hypothetical protein
MHVPALIPIEPNPIKLNIGSINPVHTRGTSTHEMSVTFLGFCFSHPASAFAKSMMLILFSISMAVRNAS